MTEKMLQWIEELARARGFTDEKRSLALVAEVRRLRESLKHHGTHGYDCERVTWPTEPASCTCGFDAALDGADE